MQQTFTITDAEILEMMYQIEHPRLVHEFDQLASLEEDEPEFWISKQWLKGRPCVLNSLARLHSSQIGD